MLQRFLQKNYWEEIGDVAGYHRAVEQLGSKWHLLDQERQGFTKDTSVWGQLAQLTDLKKKDCSKARKWLYSVWQEDRRGVKTKFYATKQTYDLPATSRNVLDQEDGAYAPIGRKVCDILFIVE